jgi:O-antigen/teichoic acid export membrane protein
VVAGVVGLFAFIQSSMGGAAQRFITMALGKGSFVEVQKTFAASVHIHFATAFLVAVLAETIGLWLLNSYLNIPEVRMDAAHFVFQTSVLSMMVGILGVPYNGFVVAQERMDIFAGMSFADVIFKLGFAWALSASVGQMDVLKLYGLLLLGWSILMFFFFRGLCNRKWPETKCGFSLRRESVLEQIHFSFWSLFGATASMSASQGVNMLLNVFCGVAVNAAMGVASSVNNAVNSFVANFQTAFRPQITKLYAQGDKAALFSLVERSAKYSFLLLFALAFPLILNMEFVIGVWLKNPPPLAVSFCRLVLVASLFNSLSGPLWTLSNATGKIRNYQIIMSLVILQNFVLSYLALRAGYAPSVVLKILCGINCLLFFLRLFLVRRMAGLPVRSFCKMLLRLVGVCAFSMPLAYWIYSLLAGWSALFASTAVFLVTIAVAVYGLALDANERRFVRRMLRKL